MAKTRDKSKRGKPAPKTRQNKPKKPFPIKAVIIAACAVVILGAAACGLGFALSVHSLTVVATVNGEPVTYGEYSHYLAADRATTASKFLSSGAQNGADFWTTPVNGQTPLDALKQTALNDAVKSKVQQMIARDNGVISDISYSAFVSAWKAQNADRAQNLADNQPIYGPQQYTESVYYDVNLSNLQSDTINAIAADAAYTDDQLRQLYEQEKDSEFISVSSLEVLRITVPFDSTDQASMTDALALANEIRAKIAAGADFADAASGYGGKAAEDDITIDMSRTRTDQNATEALLYTAQQLQAGDVSQVYQDTGWYAIIKCVQPSVSSYRAFDDVKSVLSKDMATNQYNAQVDSTVASADVQTTAAFGRIGIKQVNAAAAAV